MGEGREEGDRESDIKEIKVSTMSGSWHLCTQQEMSFRVSFLTVLMEATSGCFVTPSPGQEEQ